MAEIKSAKAGECCASNATTPTSPSCWTRRVGRAPLGGHCLHGLCSPPSASRGKRRGAGSTAGKPAVLQRVPSASGPAVGTAGRSPAPSSPAGTDGRARDPPELLCCRLSRPSSPGIPAPAISHTVLRRGGDFGGRNGAGGCSPMTRPFAVPRPCTEVGTGMGVLGAAELTAGRNTEKRTLNI